ncbi:MAG TPA: hypothetical protein VE734_12525 [Terriglobales bacterium]|nr:hypothetical protein [Terriglobales bacterium]
MVVAAITRSALLVLICAVAGWGQAKPEEAKQCPVQAQHQAEVLPSAAAQPVRPQEPQAPPPYRALSKSEKFQVFVRYTYSPYTFLGTTFDAGLTQASGNWYSYGGGMEGYGKRFGASLADNESGAFFGRFLFPVLLREDPRYLRSTGHRTLPRAGYALSRVLVTRADSGEQRPNLALILSAFAAAGLANAYYPREERGWSETAARAGGNLLTVGSTNLLREFWPDIRQRLKRHEPKAIQKIEQSPRVTKIERIMMGPSAPPQCPLTESQPEQITNR